MHVIRDFPFDLKYGAKYCDSEHFLKMRTCVLERLNITSRMRVNHRMRKHRTLKRGKGKMRVIIIKSDIIHRKLSRMKLLTNMIIWDEKHHYPFLGFISEVWDSITGWSNVGHNYKGKKNWHVKDQINKIYCVMSLFSVIKGVFQQKNVFKELRTGDLEKRI